MVYVCNNNRFYHYKDCTGIDITPRFELTTASLARKDGKLACPYCSPIGKAYIKELDRIQSYAKDYKISFQIEDGVLHMKTALARWKIFYKKKTDTFILYHESLSVPYLERLNEKGEEVVPYHKQAYSLNGLFPLVKTVINHDLYKEKCFRYKEMPVMTKRERKQKRKAESFAKRANISKTLYLIDLIAYQNAKQ